jgi:aspartate carbamoyltransferase catalytic subunit
VIGNFKGKHILHGNQFSKEDLNKVMTIAGEFEKGMNKGQTYNVMQGKILATLFFEPSTRTRLSFESAMLRLGGGVSSVASGATSSAAKGESIGDTALTVSQYADIIVIRHPKIGSAAEAARKATVPVINAGDGAGQHPTQALLDIYTMLKEVGKLDGIKIALLGDLKYGRTVHALLELLSLFKVELMLVSPEKLKMPGDLVSNIQSRGVSVSETEDLVEAVSNADILYATRIQKERFADVSEYEKLKGSYVIDNRLLQQAKDDLIILHPLPRVDEIATEVDTYQGAAYFRQTLNGVYVRMALLALALGKC